MGACMDTDHYGPTEPGSHYGCRFHPAPDRKAALDEIARINAQEGLYDEDDF